MTQLFNNTKRWLAREFEEYAGPACFGIGLMIPFVLSMDVALALGLTCIVAMMIGLALIMEREANNG